MHWSTANSILLRKAIRLHHLVAGCPCCLIHQVDLDHPAIYWVLVLLLLLEFFLGEILLEELADGLLLDTAADALLTLFPRRNLHTLVLRDWLGAGSAQIVIISIPIDAVFVGLRAELLLTLRLRMFQVFLAISLTIVLDQTPVIVLDDGDGVGLASLLGVLNYLDRAC